VMVVGFNVSEATVGVEEAVVKDPALITGTKRTASQASATIVLSFMRF